MIRRPIFIRRFDCAYEPEYVTVEEEQRHSSSVLHHDAADPRGGCSVADDQALPMLEAGHMIEEKC